MSDLERELMFFFFVEDVLVVTPVQLKRRVTI